MSAIIYNYVKYVSINAIILVNRQVINRYLKKRRFKNI